MSPLPSRDRLGEVAVKGVHFGLRQLAIAPEQQHARRLAAQARARIGSPPADARVVAFLTPRDWAAHVQWEGMIAQALRLRGADVRFITCGGGLEICDRANTWEAPPMPCATCARYVEGSVDAHGFPHASIRDGWTSDDPLPWPEVDEITAADLRAVEHDGLALGELVDVPVKWFLMAAEVDDDPLAPLTYRRFLRSARRVVRGLERALDRMRPDTVVLLNGLFFFESLCWELCRRKGIDVVTYERGFIKETLVFSRGTAACLFDMDEMWARHRDHPLSEAESAELDDYLVARSVGERTIDRFWIDPRFDAPGRHGTGRLVALFTNLTWDSAVIGQELGFRSLSDWVSALVDAFASRPEHELLIRIHPAEVKLPGKQTREPIAAFLAEHFPELPPNVRIVTADDQTSSYSIMEDCDLGLVFTSTTGLELALRGTPVIVAGRTHYRGRGFTVDVSSREELLERIDEVLADVDAHRPDVDVVRRYADLFFFKKPIGSPGVEEHILGLARLTVDDLSDLEPGRNPAVDRICDGILHGGDFAL